MTLFRKEALAYKENRLAGDVFIAVPTHWSIIGGFLFLTVFGAVLFMVFATYPRVETVPGQLLPEQGVAWINPSRSGTITRVFVDEGQKVDVGAPLFEIRVEEDVAGDHTVVDQIDDAVSKQRQSLATELNTVAIVSDAEISRLIIQRQGMLAEIGELQRQVDIQRSLVKSAEADFERARMIAERGFVSQRDLEVRKDTLFSRQQGLSQVVQAIASKVSQTNEVEQSIQRIKGQANSERAKIRATLAEVDQRQATTGANRGYQLRSPIAGQATAIASRLGQTVNPSMTLMTVIPLNSELRAELAIPNAAIGFVKVGQEVRVAIDAFPFQRFGTVTGKIISVSRSTIAQKETQSGLSSAYIAKVQMERQSIAAFGKNEKFLPGMAVTARIITDQQSLFEWIFEPIFAVRRRA